MESLSDLSELSFPNNVRYYKEHTWARIDGDLVVVGISDYAQDQLGEIIYVDLTSPYSDGWMIKVKLADKTEFENLMTADTYERMLSQ